jgi:RNA polymerase sigma-70 factor (ECF subfamily)
MLTFAELYASYAQDVYRFACWLSGSPSEAEDVTSETFVRAWTNLGRVRTETLKGYLFRIARNVYLGRLRKRRREIALPDSLSDPRPGPEDFAEWREALAGVEGVLMALREQDRAALLMRSVHSLEYAEIARVLEVSEVAARVKVHRARKLLLAWRANLEVDP